MDRIKRLVDLKYYLKKGLEELDELMKEHPVKKRRKRNQDALQIEELIRRRNKRVFTQQTQE